MGFVKRILKKFQKQKLLYWPKTGNDSFGKPIFGDVQQLPCRWEGKEQEILLPDGRKVLSHGYLLMGVVLVPGSWVFLGSGLTPMTDWQAMAGQYPNLPTKAQGGREVLVCKDTPDLKNQDHLYEAYL